MKKETRKETELEKIERVEKQIKDMRARIHWHQIMDRRSKKTKRENTATK